jgi:hypothetical protein
VCTFDPKPSMTTTPFLHPRGRVGDSRSMGMGFLGLAETEERPTEKSPISIPTQTPSHTYAHIYHRTTGYEHLRLKGKRRSTLPLCLLSGSQHRYGGASPILTLTPTPTAQPMIGTERLRTRINGSGPVV